MRHKEIANRQNLIKFVNIIYVSCYFKFHFNLSEIYSLWKIFFIYFLFCFCDYKGLCINEPKRMNYDVLINFIVCLV